MEPRQCCCRTRTTGTRKRSRGLVSSRRHSFATGMTPMSSLGEKAWLCAGPTTSRRPPCSPPWRNNLANSQLMKGGRLSLAP